MKKTCLNCGKNIPMPRAKWGNTKYCVKCAGANVCFGISLPEKIYKKLTKQAIKDRTSVSFLIREMIQEKNRS